MCRFFLLLHDLVTLKFLPDSFINGQDYAVLRFIYLINNSLLNALDTVSGTRDMPVTETGKAHLGAYSLVRGKPAIGKKFKKWTGFFRK